MTIRLDRVYNLDENSNQNQDLMRMWVNSQEEKLEEKTDDELSEIAYSKDYTNKPLKNLAKEILENRQRRIDNATRISNINR